MWAVAVLVVTLACGLAGIVGPWTLIATAIGTLCFTIAGPAPGHKLGRRLLDIRRRPVEWLEVASTEPAEVSSAVDLSASQYPALKTPRLRCAGTRAGQPPCQEQVDLTSARHLWAVEEDDRDPPYGVWRQWAADDQRWPLWVCPACARWEMGLCGDCLAHLAGQDDPPRGARSQDCCEPCKQRLSEPRRVFVET